MTGMSTRRCDRTRALLSQRLDGALAEWLHGIVHTIEGDLDNARYWYRKAHREFPGAGAVTGEITAARAALASSPSA